MNANKHPNRYLVKKIAKLPALLVGYFIIHPLQAHSIDPSIAKKETLPISELSKTSNYPIQKNKMDYLWISTRSKDLVEKNLWNKKEVFFDPKSDLTFLNKGNKLPVEFGNDKVFKFIRDKDGTVALLLVPVKGLWDKINHNKSLLRKDTIPPRQKLNAFEGFYKFQFEEGKDSYIQITAVENGIVLKQIWDGKEIHFAAQSALEFLDDSGNFSLKFKKDKNGSIIQVLAFDKDLWNKTNDYTPIALKEIHLNLGQLKACEGKFKFQLEKGEDSYIQIRATENGLVLKQMWDGKEFSFVPQSELDFYCKEAQFPIKFTKEKSGVVIQVLCFNRDLWNRVKE